MSSPMDRADWLKEKRRSAEVRMDTLWAPIYDQNWGAEVDPTHVQFLKRFLELCPPQGLILDAACGTGKYWPMILDSRRAVFGIDLSQEMLHRAHAKFPDVPIQKMGMQEMTYPETFDGAICVDAMELVCPEDWTAVLANFHRAIKMGGHFYFTVELLDELELEKAFTASRQLGLPVVYGEWAHEDGYHYYPRIEQVKEWVQQAGFRLLDETTGIEYHHFIVQKFDIRETK
jgi:SAM-dependent methyltransferase